MIRSFIKAKARFPIFSVTDLEIMRAALRNNAGNNITGFLLRDTNTYLSVVEGPDDKVDGLLQRISRDSRAFGVEVLSWQTIDHRYFPNWSMGYHEAGQSLHKTCAIEAFLKAPSPEVLPQVLSEMRDIALRQMQQDQLQEHRKSA